MAGRFHHAPIVVLLSRWPALIGQQRLQVRLGDIGVSALDGADAAVAMNGAGAAVDTNGAGAAVAMNGAAAANPELALCHFDGRGFLGHGDELLIIHFFAGFRYAIQSQQPVETLRDERSEAKIRMLTIR